MNRSPSHFTPPRHDHCFGQDQKKPGEARTLIVVALTSVTMVLEIAAGIACGSMALLADGLHMASHATALAIAMLAYVYARRHARDARYCFGTGKVNSLAGFSGAMLLAMFALVMAWESVSRLIEPVDIAFDWALVVAVVGLLVNGASVFILGHSDGHEQHEHDAGHAARDEHSAGDQHHDHNLRSAYLHVLADALTSVLAIVALLAGKYLGLHWMDPLMGIVGAILVARWSIGLLLTTGRVLLDWQGPAATGEEIRRRIEDEGNATIEDIHLWQIAPGGYCLMLSLTAGEPQPPDYYKGLLPARLGLMHVTIEIRPAAHGAEPLDEL